MLSKNLHRSNRGQVSWCSARGAVSVCCETHISCSAGAVRMKRVVMSCIRSGDGVAIVLAFGGQNRDVLLLDLMPSLLTLWRGVRDLCRWTSGCVGPLAKAASNQVR